jgi:hypothetical protein
MAGATILTCCSRVRRPASGAREYRQVDAPSAAPSSDRDLERGREWAGWEIARVFAPARHVRDAGRIARPKAHRVSPGKGNGQRGTPRPGAENGYSHCALSVGSREM